MDVATLTTFLGWCTVLNFGMLILASLIVMMGRKRVATMHSAMMGVDEAELPVQYFSWLGNYKMMIYVFNLMPWVALKLMA